MTDKKIIIIGGGLAGLVASLHLTRSGVPCFLIEKKSYPFHRVCGEYISNETVPYLKSLEAYPSDFNPPDISQFQLTSVSGQTALLPLDPGGFGISRYRFDEFLYRRACRQGVHFLLDTEVESVVYNDAHFMVQTQKGSFEADLVIGSFGKRSKLDVQLNRPFIQKRSPYVGVKYHIRLKSFPADLIGLHNFQDGYCGISRVEDDRINLCYLTHRNNLKKYGTVQAMEEAVLFRNPFLKRIYHDAEFIMTKPETINEISFESKAPVEGRVLMAGDAAGMITPLCGNGMAMAIHAAKILSEHVVRFASDSRYSRDRLEADYAKAWTGQFAGRLWAGRQIQRLFGHPWTSNAAVQLMQHVRPVARYLMKKTHGDVF